MVPSPIPAAPAAASPFARADHTRDCPLHALAREADALIARKTACDARAIDAPGPAERRAAQKEMDRLGRALDGLATWAAYLPAASREGALFALVLAAGEVETIAIADEAPGPALERLVRHLWTIRRVLEREAALPEAAGEYWMPRRLAPG